MTSKIQYKIFSSTFIFLLLVLVSQPISADTLSLTIGQISVIRVSNVNRIRVNFDISPLENTKVDYAEIMVPHFLTSGAITVEGWRLNSETPNDYDTAYNALYKTHASLNLPIILDITKFIKYWVENGNNFGILLKRPYYEGGGFRGELQNLGNALANARIRVFFNQERD